MVDFYNEVLKRKDDLLNDLRTLCQIPSVLDEETASENAPFGLANRKALDQMLAFGKRDGFITNDVDGYAGDIDIGEGDEIFGILGHLDVVPVNETGWDYPQFDATLDGDSLYGRGVADDKGPLLAAYYAAKIVNELDFEKKYKIRVIFGCDEENGSSCVKYYFKHRPYPAMGFTPDADFPVVYGEKAMVDMNLYGTYDNDVLKSFNGGNRSNVVPNDATAIFKGAIELLKEGFNKFLNDNNTTGEIVAEGDFVKVIVKGKSAHGSMPQRGLNAISLLAHYLNSVIDHPLVDYINKYFYNDTQGKALNINHQGELGELTVNLGILTFENKEAKVVLDIRFSNEIDPVNDVVNKIISTLDKYSLTNEYDYKNALYVDPNSELIVKLHNSYVEFTKDTKHGPQTMGGGTYAKEMPNCVAFGAEFPGRNNRMHEDNETILLEELLKSSAIYAKALYDIIKK